MATIQIPDIVFSGHYYAEILEDLIRHMRANCPELSDELDTEPHIQLLRTFSMVGHLNNCLLDMVAAESFLPTARLRSSHRNLLALIGVQLKQTSPASADLLVQLTKAFISPITTVPAKSSFATLETRPAPAVEFEVLADVSLTQRTDQVGGVLAFDASGSTYSNHTAEAITPTGNFTVGWGGAGDVEAGDAIYVGHPDVMFDVIRFNIATAITGGTITAGVWEYFDGNLSQGIPDNVINLGSTLRFVVNSILGPSNRTGTVVRVRSNITGGFADLVVAFVSGENRIETTIGLSAFLGQMDPSLDVSAYIVGTSWRELSDLQDATGGFSQTGFQDVKFSLPQTVTQNWRRGDVNSISAFWARYRVISVSSTPSPPSLTEVRIHDGKQYQIFEVSQGRSRSDEPLGSSDGTGNQQFVFSNFPVIDDDNLRVFVDESGIEREYTRVVDFLNSISTDRHFMVEFDDDGIATITFGDGTNGKIPPSGVNNVRSQYRTSDEQDGNVGQDTITVNRSGVAFVSTVRNPRAAAGFLPKEGSTDEDLVRLKIAGPAALRTRERAVSPQDAEEAAKRFVASDGSSPVTRALAQEEAFGPKTVEIVVVGAGGNIVDSSKLQEIEDYFNGTELERGRLLMNHEATVTNFIPRVIGVTATVTRGEESAIVTALAGLLNPLAINPDGTWVWEFGGLVPLAKIIATIMNTSPSPTNVNITGPEYDVNLMPNELPDVGVLDITIVNP